MKIELDPKLIGTVIVYKGLCLWIDGVFFPMRATQVVQNNPNCHYVRILRLSKCLTWFHWRAKLEENTTMDCINCLVRARCNDDFIVHYISCHQKRAILSILRFQLIWYVFGFSLEYSGGISYDTYSTLTFAHVPWQTLFFDSYIYISMCIIWWVKWPPTHAPYLLR